MSSSTGSHPAFSPRLLTRNRRGVSALLVALLSLVAPCAVAYADPGDADAGFGDGGRVNTDFLHHLDGAYAVAVQPDGRIVAGGFTSKQANDQSIDFGLTRYNSDGTLDDGFGTGGRVTTDFAANFDEVRAMAIQPDGKIVAVGFADLPSTLFDVAVARYMPDGTPDAGFGNGGKVAIDIGENDDFGEAVAVLPGGAILVGGLAYNPVTGEDFALVQLTPDGRLDPGFGTGGMVTTDFFHLDDEITDMVVTEDGRIVVTGFTFKTSVNELYAVARYTSDGTPDASFGDDGRVAEDLPDLRGAASSAVVDQDGAIVVGGGMGGATSDFVLARFTDSGDLDATFGVGGITRTDFFGFNDHINALVVVGDKIVAGGNASHTSSASSGDMAIARYNHDGTLDAAFGDGGKATLDYYGRSDFIEAMAVDASGSCVVAGGVYTSTDEDFGVARFEGDPPPEPDFSLALTTPTLTVTKKQKGQIEVLVNRVGDFTQEVSVAAPDTKSIKVKLTPASVATTGSRVMFDYKIKKKAMVGSYELVFTGIDGSGRSRMVTLTLVIQ